MCQKVQPQLVAGRAPTGPSLGLVDAVSLSPPEGKCPASAYSSGIRPAKGVLQVPVLPKLFPTLRAAPQDPAVQSQHFSYTTWECQKTAAIRLCHQSSPAYFKFSTSLLQNQRQHFLPGISNWQEGEIVLELVQVTGTFAGLLPAVGRRRKIREKEMGRDEARLGRLQREWKEGDSVC